MDSMDNSNSLKSPDAVRSPLENSSTSVVRKSSLEGLNGRKMGGKDMENSTNIDQENGYQSPTQKK